MAQQIGLEAVLDLGQFNRGVGGYLSGLDRMSGKTGSFAGAVGGHFQSIGKLALGATAALAVAGVAAGAAVAKFAVDGIGKAKDLEAQMSNIAAVLNKTAAEVAPLNDLILELGLDPNLKVSAVEAADAIEMLARNGLSMTEIMDGAAHSTVLLANATGADFSTAANIATDAMAIFKIEAADMATAVNGISAVTTNSKFDINDYALALSQGAGVASAAGVSFDDFNTSIAAISPLFASGSDAGTSFKTMIASLNPKSDEAATLMKQLGINFYDANGQMKDMADIATELNEAFFQEVQFSTTVSNATAEQNAQRKLLESTIQRTNTELYKYQVGINGVAQSENDKIVSIDRLNRQHDAAIAAYGGLATAMGTTITTTRELTEAEKNAALQTIFGSDASRAAIALAESGAVVYTDLATAVTETGLSQEILNQYLEGGITQFELLEAQMSQTDAAEQAKTRMDNLAGALEILQGVIDTIQIKIGQTLLPMLRRLTEWATEFVTQHADAILAAFEGFSQNLEALIKWLVITVEEGDNANDWLTHMNPLLADAVLNISNLVMGTANLVGAIKEFLQPVTDAIAGFVEWKDVLIVLGAAIAAVVIPAIAGIIVAISPVLLILGGAILAVAGVRKAWETDFLGIKTATLNAFNAIKTALTPLTSAIQQFGIGALTEIRDWATGNQTAFTNVRAIWEGTKQAASNLFTGITSFAASHLPGWRAKLTEWATAGAAWVQNATTAALGYLAQWVAAITDYVAAQLPTWKAKLTEWATAAWQWIVDASALVATKLAQWFADLKAALDAKLPGWKAALLTWATAAWQWIVDAAALVAGKIAIWYAGLKAALDAKLPTWKTAFTAWATAAWQWIVDASALLAEKIGTWYTRLQSTIAAKLPTLKTEMLKFATAMVTWITDKAADALPALGTWLGKILAWIPLGIIDLATGLVKMAAALIGWIASDKDSATSKTDPEMAKFQKALGDGVAKIGAALVLAFQNMVTEWQTTMSEYVDWNALGETIMGKIKLGIINVRQAITDVFSNLAQSLHDLVLETDWLELGKSLLTLIRDGVSGAASKLYDQMRKLAREAAQKVIDFDWKGLGKDIIDGILKGLKDNGDAIVDYLYGLGEQALAKIKAFFGITSPSRVMAEVGRNIIEGWILGMRQAESGLLRATNSLTSKILGSIVRSRVDAVQELSSALDNITNIGGSYLESNLDNQSATDNYTAEQKRYDILKQQADLVKYIRDAGGDPRSFLSGITLGDVNNQKPGDILNAIAAATKTLNDNLANTLRIAGQGWDKLISDLQAGRKSIEEIEGAVNSRFAARITGLDAYRERINKIDEQIANTEDRLLKTGDQASSDALWRLTSQRNGAVAALEDYLYKVNEIERRMGSITVGGNQRATDAIAAFRSAAIDPLIQSLGNPDIGTSGRANFNTQIHTQINAVQAYAAGIAEIEAAQKQFNDLFGGTAFSQTIQDNMQSVFDSLYTVSASPEATAIRQQKLRELQTYASQVHSTIRQAGRISGDTPGLERYQTQVLDPLLNRMLDINTTTAQRTQLLFEYTAAVNKVVAVEQKQGNLKQIQDHLDLLQKSKDLSDKLGGRGAFDRIFAGIDPKKALTADQLATVMARYTDEAIRLANLQIIDINAGPGRLEQLQDQLDLLQKVTALSEQLGGRDAFERIFAGIDPKMALTAEQMATVMARYTNEAIRLANRQIIDIADLATARDYSVELGRIVDRAISFESVLAEFDSEPMTPLDQAQGYLEYYDREIVRLRTLAAEGNQASLSMAQNVMVQRDRIVQYMRTYLDKLYRADLQLDRLQESSNERAQKVAENYRKAFIDPLREQIGTSFSTSFQDNAINLLGSRVDKVNAYIASIKQMGDIEADISQARALNPLMGMLAAERIDPLIERLYDINTTEAQRLQITQQLVAEQQKLVALQEKQQKLDFLQQQLDLFNQIEQLNEQFDDIIPMSTILDGITFGLDASLDDMLTLTSRSIDAIITAVKHQLGIASPSKVFAKIGKQTMQGLASGIQSAVSQPLSMMRSVASSMPYAMESRSLAVNMGGVTISNGMDEVMFEARVRQIMEGAF